MAEYIEREAITAKFKQMGLGEHGLTERLFADGVYAVIEMFPAADVAPVVHGRWDDSGRYKFPSGKTAVRCSECGCSLTESGYNLYVWDYCPVCGAKMDGGSNDDTHYLRAANINRGKLIDRLEDENYKLRGGKK